MGSQVLLSTTPQSSIALSSSSRIHNTLAQRNHIPAHVYKHPAAILLELCTSMEELHQIIPLIIKNGLYEEHLFQTKLVSLFCRYGSLTEATRVFDSIEDKNDAVYHTMLKGYAQNSTIFDGVSFFCRMMDDGVQPVVYNFTYLLKGCGESCLVRKGKEVHAQLILNGHEGDVYAMTCVVNISWHSHSKKIYAFLETLLDRIKAAGYVSDTDSIHDVEDDLQEKMVFKLMEMKIMPEVSRKLCHTSPADINDYCVQLIIVDVAAEFFCTNQLAEQNASVQGEIVKCGTSLFCNREKGGMGAIYAFERQVYLRTENRKKQEENSNSRSLSIETQTQSQSSSLLECAS
ncbi:hypothetical protein L6452_17845 [Arctium lappa]|uniref:Uncharacterized protein n=1 Tax=Arctium lappa TaxID=4217 RepID=A0ACB9C4T3_ARCLA|nr:hypothetical protein L6452_17845 [Arctium lappa]